MQWGAKKGRWLHEGSTVGHGQRALTRSAQADGKAFPSLQSGILNSKSWLIIQGDFFAGTPPKVSSTD